MTKVCYWDNKEGVQRERDMTPAEEAQHASDIAAALIPTEVDYVNAVQNLLDATARARQYDNILSACTYVGSNVQKFRDEGQACLNWRGAVWAKCYDLLAQVKAGTLAQPTIPELLAMLPVMAWPD